MSQINKEYKTIKPEVTITSKELAKAAPAIQKEVIEIWFRENFRKPKPPEKTQSGNYIGHFWGFPYDPHTVLTNEFRDEVQESIIEELANVLYSESMFWTATPEKMDPEVDHLSITLGIDFYDKFLEKLRDILSLSKLPANGELKIHLLRILHISVITTLETYLYHVFLNRVLNNEILKKNFVKYNKDFANHFASIPFNRIYEEYEKIDSQLEKYIGEFGWHQLERVKGLFESTFHNLSPGVQFPDIGNLMREIQKRHLLVHRGGVKEDGTEIKITEENIEILITEVKTFAGDIQKQVRGEITIGDSRYPRVLNKAFPEPPNLETPNSQEEEDEPDK